MASLTVLLIHTPGIGAAAKSHGGLVIACLPADALYTLWQSGRLVKPWAQSACEIVHGRDICIQKSATYKAAD